MSAGSFDTFFESFDADSGKRGKQWEFACKWFLENDGVYSELERVWLWDDWPDRDGPDIGIDLVAKTKDGKLWAVQAKAWEANITKSDIDSFFSASEGSHFRERLLITTSEGVAPNARRTIDESATPFSMVCRHDLEDRDCWPESYAALEAGQRPQITKATPRPHQQEALDAALEGLQHNDRGQVIMACGTGKTLTALWLHERLSSERTLVVLPSLSLLNQTLIEWTKYTAAPFQFLPVCSDETVGQGSSEDAALQNTSTLGYPVTTDPAEVRDFLTQAGQRVIFSTYQSSPVVAEAMAGSDRSFDLIIADEAHRCAGRISTAFGTLLDQEKIPSRKRIFMTATPRVFASWVTRLAREDDQEIASMDDAAVFGSELYRLSFAQAIERDLLSDYRVLVVGIDDAEYRRYAEYGRFVTIDGEEVNAREVASQIGLAKAIHKYDLHRIITFHGRVKKASRFSRMLLQVVAWMPGNERPTGPLWGQAVSGKMPTGERRRHLNRLKKLEDSERGILSNARCLGEGIDVPTLDGIAFIDPKQSQVDIVQAVGRAIRKGDEQKTSTIVIPVFIEPGEDGEAVLDASAYKAIAVVLRALRAHDELLAEELDAARREIGRQGGGRVRTPGKVIVDLPKSLDKDFSSKIETELVNLTTPSWEEGFARLQKYVKQHGNARPRATYKDPDGYTLGQWIAVQRGAEETMSPERKQRLESVEGWVWDAQEADWEEGFAGLQKYVEQYGNARPPYAYKDPDGYRLGQWIAVQRQAEETMSPERKQRLESVEGWVWDAQEADWEEGFLRLQKYVEQHGNARPPQAYKDPDGYRLGRWISVQRRAEETMSPERKQRLESVEGWVWDAVEADWEEGFAGLQKYVEQHGNARPPQAYKDPDGYRLGRWISVQRRAEETMSPERKQRLESVEGWVWDARESPKNSVIDLAAKKMQARGSATTRANVESPED